LLATRADEKQACYSDVRRLSLHTTVSKEADEKWLSYLNYAYC
jgi:hypothetical protein